MGHGILGQPLYRQHQLTSDANKQYRTTDVEYGQSSVSGTIRLEQSCRLANPVRFPSSVPDATSRVHCPGLATERGQCI